MKIYQIIPRSTDRYEGLLRCVIFRRTMKLYKKLSEDSDMTYKDDVKLFKDIRYILQNVKRYIIMNLYKNIPKVIEIFQNSVNNISTELDRFLISTISLSSNFSRTNY